jgi:hypothetical protein
VFETRQLLSAVLGDEGKSQGTCRLHLEGLDFLDGVLEEGVVEDEVAAELEVFL